jgi:hypothetical protein
LFRCKPEQAQRVDRAIALPFREGGEWSTSRPGRFTSGKDPVPIVQEAEWAPGPVWTCAKNLARTGIRSPDRPAHSQSLYRLSYPAISRCIVTIIITLQTRMLSCDTRTSSEITAHPHLPTCSVMYSTIHPVLSVAAAPCVYATKQLLS